MERIQFIAVIVSLFFMAYVVTLVVKGKLREEYSIVWIVCTIILIILSVWTSGMKFLANLLGVYAALNLLFTGALFAILVYLLHLSVVVSKIQDQNKELAQYLALMENRVEKDMKKDNRQSTVDKRCDDLS
ncbi:MAG TPA: DUF2304 domain-containing protein [Nitrospirota bacterium]|nr:DUF2304 domain-containing protein [Nitrospirota bacterium]